MCYREIHHIHKPARTGCEIFQCIASRKVSHHITPRIFFNIISAGLFSSFNGIYLSSRAFFLSSSDFYSIFFSIFTQVYAKYIYVTCVMVVLLIYACVFVARIEEQSTHILRSDILYGIDRTCVLNPIFNVILYPQVYLPGILVHTSQRHTCMKLAKRI